MSRQCRLLSVSRAPVYRRPAQVSEEDCTIMALIDRQYLARPYYGARRMAWLATQGHVVNPKRAQRLMRLTGLVAIYQRPNIRTTRDPPEAALREPAQVKLIRAKKMASVAQLTAGSAAAAALALQDLQPRGRP